MSMASSLASRRVRILLLAVAIAAGIGVLAWIFWPRTVLDTGPLDLPGVPDAPGQGEEVLLAVGDIAFCNGDADDRVAELAASLPGTIATLGDTVYPEATEEHLRECLEPSWGGLRDRMRPAVGNHDYVGGSADAYFDWFGPRAGNPGEGWYSYELGSWHVVVLNSECELAGCEAGSPQHEWLVDDLAQADAECLVAYWHEPMLSSGRHGGSGEVEDLWEAVTAAGVDVTLHGHDHSYEHLSVEGVDSFVVGTGGRSLYLFERDPLPETVARHDRNYGLLYLVLGDGTFTWDFLALGATTFSDSGSGDC